MSTEDVSARFIDVDGWPVADQLIAMHEGQLAAVASLGAALPAMERAVEAAARALSMPGEKPGRLVYVGAGTSGRLAVLDGVELTPTFGWPAERVVFLMAGGFAALTSGIEGAEDDAPAAERAIEEAKVGAGDVVIGIAASGRTPYTVAALKAARDRGAVTIGFANSPDSPLLAACEHAIFMDSGAEVIAGSTRMKAGAAQKVGLTILSSAIMIRLGHVYKGLMVDMRPTNVKLQARAVGIVARLAAVPEAAAAAALSSAGGDIKLGVLLARGLSDADARTTLQQAHGNLREALKLAGPAPTLQSSNL